MRRFRRLSLTIVSFLLCSIVLLGCSTSAQSSGNPQLKEQVLQIIRENPQVIKESVQAYEQQQQQQLSQARQSFLQQMLTNPAAVIGNSPTTGAAAKKIVLLEFSDFQCPYCAKAHATVKQFMDKHKDKVTLAYKHLPLTSIHPQAEPASKSAWAAGQQGKFWEYYDALFTQQDKLGEPLYAEIAKKLDLNIDKFNSDRNGSAAAAAIQEDVKLAQTLGITGTPFFFLNAEAFPGAIELSEMENILARVTSRAK